MSSTRDRPLPLPGAELSVNRGPRQRLRLVLVAAALWLPGAPALADLDADRERYKAAIKAVSRGDEAALAAARRELADYPLLPYLEAAWLQRHLDDEGAVRAWLAAHGELPVADDLRRRWLGHLARQGRWADFLRDERPQRSVSLRCHGLQARILTGSRVPMSESHQDLWLAGRSQPEACDPVFGHWREHGELTPVLVRERAFNAVRAGEYRLARWLGRDLDQADQAALERWIALRRQPASELAGARRWPDTEVNRMMLGEEIARLAGRDADRAAAAWARLEDVFRFSPAQRSTLPRRIQLLRATDYPEDALASLRALPESARDLQIREWTVRVALHSGQWREVLAALDELPPADAQRQRWRYWRARALEALGRHQPAQALYAELASEATYHGFLAAERLGRPYALCPQLRSVSAEDLAGVADAGAFERAVELFHVDQRHHARREFARFARDLDPDQRRTAAVLIAAEGWHEQAIATLANAGALRLYSLRFPLAFASPVARESARRGLNPSLVYAVMRSESALAPDAVSSANARGLMQLTRDTGRRVARRYQLPTPSLRDLFDPERNIALGSAYLDQLFDRFGHPLLVLAAYNAGPTPVERWQAAGMPVDADRWIETLPYHETREYLPRVLAFATIYDWRRHGRMVPLRYRMPDLDQRPGKSDRNARPSIQPACTLPVSTARAGGAMATGGER